MPTERSAEHQRLLQRALQGSGGTARDLLFDPVTSLPTLQLLLPKIRDTLVAGRGIGIVTVNISRFSMLEDIYGWETFDQIVRGVSACLSQVKDDSLRREDTLAELTVNGNVFLLVLSPPRRKRVITAGDLARVLRRVTKRLDAHLAGALAPDLLHRFGHFAGGAILRPEPTIRLERMVYRAIDQALNAATTAEAKTLEDRGRALRRILTQRRITTVYHPIIDLERDGVMGYEALSRGPRGELETPELLFRVAREADLIWKLDRLCREQALRGLRRMPADQLLFLNVEPESVFDPAMLETLPARRHAARIVFEITEHAAISDFTTFRQAVRTIKRAGFQVAVDDVGAAYSGLRAISEISPDFIKLDMALTRGADTSQVKLQLMRAVAAFSHEAQIPLIVEGVENAAELEVVRSVGARFAQGFVYGRPAAVPRRSARPA